MIRTLQNIWDERSGREKILIGIAFTLLSMLALWLFVYKPLSQYPDRQMQALKQAELDLKIMQKGQGALLAQSDSTSRNINTLSARQFQTTITNAAKPHNLVIARRQPKGDEEISLWLEKADSKALYGWVDELTGSYNVVLSKAQLYRNDDGTIRALVTFKLADKS